MTFTICTSYTRTVQVRVYSVNVRYSERETGAKDKQLPALGIENKKRDSDLEAVKSSAPRTWIKFQ